LLFHGFRHLDETVEQKQAVRHLFILVLKMPDQKPIQAIDDQTVMVDDLLPAGLLP
jgi:hypothetical protein